MDAPITTSQAPTTRPDCGPATGYRHHENVDRMNGKNPHAVALGHMTSKDKAAAAQKNGQKGGNPADF